MSPFKPMLASEADLSRLRFPVLASPKFDGVRCIVHPELGAVSRNLKPIPNHYIRGLLNAHARGLDGELVIGDPTAKDCFQRTTSGVMSRDGEPEFTFWAFDMPWLVEPGDADPEVGHNANTRLMHVRAECTEKSTRVAPWLRWVPHMRLRSLKELDEYEAAHVAQGWEGVMLRDPAGLYKQGRSTVREGGLLKLKRFKDDEAVVVGAEELMHNGNEATINVLGHTERSSHKANLVHAGTLGALVVEFGRTAYDSEGNYVSPASQFSIGTGFTQAQRDDLWARRADLVGQVIKFRYQEVGTKDLPRFPSFIGFRDPGDL